MKLWTLALAEMRTCRRMVRTWVLIAISTTVCLVQWIIVVQRYEYDSMNSSSYGITSPRFLMLDLALPIVACFATGILFLAFDIRSRDIRQRMFEVIDSRPFSNAELVFGRLLGIVLLLSIAAVVIVVSITGYSGLATLFDFPLGSILEPVSVLAFLTWDIIPNLFLWGSLTVLLSVVLRFRILVVVVVLGLLLLYHRFNATMPLFLMSSLSTYTGAAIVPSELATQFASGDLILNRLLVMLISLSFLLLATGLHIRLAGKPSRQRMITFAACTLTVAVLAVSGQTTVKVLEQKELGSWASVHRGHSFHTVTDIDTVKGTIEVRPGQMVNLDLTLTLAPIATEEGRWLLSLNPGYRVNHISVNDEPISNYEFEDGLLRIPANTTSDTPSEVHLVASGVPNPRFSYLDTSLDLSSLLPAESRRLLQLGRKPYIFHSKFFAMMPGVSWFPTSGSAYGRGTLESRPTDYFNLDIEVSVPEDWLVAGPGSRTQIKQKGRTRYRFNPQAPIPEFALIGSRFERRAFSAAGVDFELLLSEKHTKNLHTLNSVAPALRNWIQELSEDLKQYGLKYPYSNFSFVEVPDSMRVYGGGWQMDSVYSQPGIQMMRESGFPTAEFERAVDAATERFDGSEKEVEQYLFGLLKNYFQNDLYGGSPLLGLAKQFVGYQTSPVGAGATALNFVSNELATKLISDSQVFFSIHALLSPDTDFTRPTESAPDGYFAQHFFHFMRSFHVDHPAVWEHALSTPLADLDFRSQSSEAHQVLMLKSLGICQSILDFHGEEEVGHFLNELVNRFRGRSYSPDEFFESAIATEIDLESLLGSWLYTSDIPGIVVADTTVELVKHDSQLYQTTLVLRNGTNAPSVVNVYYEEAGSRYPYLDEPHSDPVLLPGNSSVRIALQTDSPLASMTLRPRLSRNREEIRIRVPTTGEIELADSSAILPYISEVEWKEEISNSIVVDDLDSGFSVLNGEDYSRVDKPNWWVTHFLGIEKFKPTLNYGLPSTLSMDEFLRAGSNHQWQRDFCHGCFGEYYKTSAVSLDGFDQPKASFSLELPSNGMWKLEYYVPDISTDRYVIREGNVIRYGTRTLGLHEIAVAVGEQETVVELDAAEAESGWNNLGTYEITDRNTAITVIGVRDGMAIADAIKWTPIEDD